MSEDIEIPEEVKDSPHFANVRRRAETAEAERDALKAQVGQLRGQLTGQAVELAGFKPNAEGAYDGVVGLVVEKFQQSLTDDVLPSKDTFAALAEQYGVKPEGAVVLTAPVDAAAELARLQAPGDQLRSMGSIPEPASLEERKAALLAGGQIGALMDLELSGT